MEGKSWSEILYQLSDWEALMRRNDILPIVEVIKWLVCGLITKVV